MPEEDAYDPRPGFVALVKAQRGLVMLVLFWVFTTLFLGPLIYVVLPASVFFLAFRDRWEDLLFGFIILLILSDSPTDFIAMRKIKSAKYGYVIAMMVMMVMKRQFFQPFSKVFIVFLPFFVYSLFPLFWSDRVLWSLSKLISYSLLFLVVPNYVLLCYRRKGDHFLRDLAVVLTMFFLAMVLVDLVLPKVTNAGVRHRGLFGNPNGLGIFSYLSFVLLSLVFHLRRDLFSRFLRLFMLALVMYFVLRSGSRASLVSVAIFLVFSRFFALSPFVGIIAFVGLFGLYELVASNLAQIVFALGLEDYLRVETLDTGSGRYVAWEFAWERIQDVFLFGGGFGYEENIMRRNLHLLSMLGHQGGVHNSYLSLWFNTGVVGMIIYFRSFLLLFIKASKFVPIAFAILFSVLFSIMYESWLMGSLNPYTIMLVIVLTITTEEEVTDTSREVLEEAAPAPVA